MITIDLDSNDGIDIQDIRPFMILNTITIADIITSNLMNKQKEIKQTEVYKEINKYLKKNYIIDKIYDDCETILYNNEDIEFFEME